MKDKNVAALLAFLGGFIGLHQFYLGNVMLGMMCIAGTYYLKFKLMMFLSFWVGIGYLTQKQEKFDKKYNSGRSSRRQDYNDNRRREELSRQRPEAPRPPQQQASGWEQIDERIDGSFSAQSAKKEGITKYKNYDFKGAAIAFEQALIHDPDDVPTLFNLACAYSMNEEKKLGFEFLAKAVAAGLKDFGKISIHDGLAYLRIQKEWDNFVANNYKMVDLTDEDNSMTPMPAVENTVKSTTETTPTIPADENPLDTLRRLYEQRQKGIIDEQQFERESKKLLAE